LEWYDDFEPDAIGVTDVDSNAIAEPKPDAIFFSNSLFYAIADSIRLSLAITHCFGYPDPIADVD